MEYESLRYTGRERETERYGSLHMKSEGNLESFTEKNDGKLRWTGEHVDALR